jgi:hypothetical protein
MEETCNPFARNGASWCAATLPGAIVASALAVSRIVQAQESPLGRHDCDQGYRQGYPRVHKLPWRERRRERSSRISKARQSKRSLSQGSTGRVREWTAAKHSYAAFRQNHGVRGQHRCRGILQPSSAARYSSDKQWFRCTVGYESMAGDARTPGTRASCLCAMPWARWLRSRSRIPAIGGPTSIVHFRPVACKAEGAASTRSAVAHASHREQIVGSGHHSLIGLLRR